MGDVTSAPTAAMLHRTGSERSIWTEAMANDERRPDDSDRRAAPPPLEEQVAVVSSGERSVGLALVRRLAELGMRVVMGTDAVDCGRTALDGMGDLADRIAVRHLDLADPESVSVLAQRVDRQLGRCNVLVNNGANLLEGEGGVGDLRVGTAPRAAEMNLLGIWRLTQAIAPLMRRHHHGRVVNLTSGVGWPDRMTSRHHVDNPGQPAMNMLTRILADELVDDGILANACCVGPPEVTREGPDHSEAVASAAWLATLPADGPTGRFFRNRVPASG